MESEAKGAFIRALVNRWYRDVWEVRREATIDEMMAPECRVIVQGQDAPLDAAAFKAYRATFLNAVPDLQIEWGIVAVEENNAVTSWRATGTHSGNGLGIPPSNGRVDFSGMTRFHFQRGLIVGGADSWNRGEMIASLMQVRMRELCESAGLTVRESQVALLMAERLSHVEISRELGVARNTSRRHCEQVLRKLAIESRREVGAALGRIPGGSLPKHAVDIKDQPTHFNSNQQ